jgi:PEGA domain
MSTITKGITKVALLVAVLIVTSSATAQAQRFGGGFGGRFGPHWGFSLGVAPFYDPFWGPYYPYAGYPYVVGHPTASVRVEVVPKQTEVFVDGYFAGTAGKVRTTPGGHAITLFLPGYRTVTQNIYVAPASTVKMQDTMVRLTAGEVSAPPPQPSRPLRPATQPPSGTPNQG